MVEIVEAIDLNKVYKQLADVSAGGTCLFIGTVRNHSSSKQVTALEFESYEEMAVSEMERIENLATKKWQLCKVLISHAVGFKEVGEPVVVVGASASHRKDAFPACRFLIDELKKTVPIWKKEFFLDHSEWVSPTP